MTYAASNFDRGHYHVVTIHVEADAQGPFSKETGAATSPEGLFNGDTARGIPQLREGRQAPADSNIGTDEAVEQGARGADEDASREPPVEDGEGGSAGAAAVADTTLAQEKLARAYKVDKAITFASPILRTATSPSLQTRRAAQALAETPFFYEKNALGMASDIAVESRVKLWNAPLGRALEELDRLFVKYRTGREFTRGRKNLERLRSRAGKLSYSRFKEEVSRAMRREDAHNVPEVAEAARMFRATLFDPLKERAIDTGLLPEDVSVDH